MVCLLQLFDEAYRKKYTCVTRWYLTCVSQAPFQSIFKDSSLCKTPLTGALHHETPNNLLQHAF